MGKSLRSPKLRCCITTTKLTSIPPPLAAPDECTGVITAHATQRPPMSTTDRKKRRSPSELLAIAQQRVAALELAAAQDSKTNHPAMQEWQQAAAQVEGALRSASGEHRARCAAGTWATATTRPTTQSSTTAATATSCGRSWRRPTVTRCFALQVATNGLVKVALAWCHQRNRAALAASTARAA